MATDCIRARPVVIYLAIWLIFFLPISPSFESCASFGITTCRSCIIMVAVMYGIIPREKTANLESAPPEKRSIIPSSPDWT